MTRLDGWGNLHTSGRCSSMPILFVGRSFIDADIYVVEPIPELFRLLDRFDCAATHEEYLDTDWSHHYPQTEIPASFPEFNTGILMLKRSEAMRRTLAEGGALYQ